MLAYFFLLKLGCQVNGLSLEPDSSNVLYNKLVNDKNFLSSKFYKKYKHFDCDIRNKDKFTNLILRIKPEFIFHLAAQPLVRESYKNPISTWETNVMGTINLLNTIKDFKSCSIVVVTTDKVYENKSRNYCYRENDLLGGYDPYSSSKASVELAFKSWRKSFFNNKIKISTARAGNVIVGGD